jgi:hypothetical protein
MRLSPHIGVAFLLAAGLTLSPPQCAVAAATQPQFARLRTTSIEGIGDYTSVALDQLGRAHVAYFDQSRQALVYAFQTQSGWRTELVDADGVEGWYASLALDSRGNARIAYYSVAAGALKYASRVGGAWSTQVVDGSSERVGHYCSLALDANDNPSISYYDAQNLSLRYASLVGGNWVTETVDGAGNAAETDQALNRADRASNAPAVSQDVPNVGHYTSLAVDRQGVPHIAYQDVTNADLKVAVKQGGEWATETVDSRDDVGEHTSLKLDAAGNMVVSYYDLQNGALKLATQKAGEWTTQTVDQAGDVGAYSSLVLDAQGRPHISYMDAGRQALKYASEQDGVWMTQTVDASGATGRNTSLALDRSGAPVIAYTARNGKGSFRMVSASVQFGGRPAGGGGEVATARSLTAWPLPYKGGALSVSFVIPARGGAAELSLIDLAGRRVRTLQQGALEAGRQVIAWDGRDDAGRNVANGVYFLISRAGGQESKLKLVVLR